MQFLPIHMRGSAANLTANCDTLKSSIQVRQRLLFQCNPQRGLLLVTHDRDARKRSAAKLPPVRHEIQCVVYGVAWPGLAFAVWIVQVIAVCVGYSNSAGSVWAYGLGIAWPVTWIDDCAFGGTDKGPSIHRELQQPPSKSTARSKTLATVAIDAPCCEC